MAVSCQLVRSQLTYQAHQLRLVKRPLMQPRAQGDNHGLDLRYSRSLRSDFYDLTILGDTPGERMLQTEADEELRLPRRKSLDSVAKELARLLAVETQALLSADRSRAVSQACATIAYVLVRRLGYKLGEVAAYFGRDSRRLPLYWPVERAFAARRE